MQDIIFRTDDKVFSYRVAGILIHNGKVLLQQPVGDKAYSIPGGHAAFGETSEQTVIREFKEEIGADVKVLRLLSINENFFPWGERACHQIGVFYLISLCDEKQIQTDGKFRVYDVLEGKRFELDFCWIPLEELDKTIIYPEGISKLIKELPQQLQHSVINQKTRLD